MSSVVVAARRTAVAPRNGALSLLELHELSVPVISACLSQAGIESAQVDELIVGNALGAGGNPARVIALAAGLNETVAGMTIDRQCCAGLDSLLLANALIESGQASVVIAGGVESYSRRPERIRIDPHTGHREAYEQPPFTPWPERDPRMSDAADALASSLGISAAEQDAWAIDSHRKALDSVVHLQDEIVPIGTLDRDAFARKLTPALCRRAKRLVGDISSANTAVAADAAAFCVLVSEDRARTLSVPGVRLLAGRTLGADPQYPGSAPVAAMKSVLQDRKLQGPDLSCVEIMEAYAAQAIACMRLAEIDPARVNRHGGALARGHAIGASGAILAVRLFNDLVAGGGMGLAAIAAAGGLGTALLLQS